MEVECDYFLDSNNEYNCLLFAIDFIPRNTTVTFIGNHTEGFDESMVDVVRIYFSNVEFVIPEIYTTFPNLNELDLEFTAINVIDQIPTDLPNFAWFISFFNDVEVVQNNTFINVGETLFFVDFEVNEIEELELDAFAGCAGVFAMYIDYNRIPQPPTGTFWPLTGLVDLDIGVNRFGFIDDTLFSNNTQLEFLWINSNQIDRITPRFFRTFDNLRYLFAYSNDCIDRSFVINEPAVEAFMHASLAGCYGAFEDLGPDDARTVQFVFQGPLSLSDSFGNPILVLN